MREIKFRAWNFNEMLTTPIANSWGLGRFFGFLGEADIVMQYTGLKDKNGVEIYEGDIVRILYTDWPSKSPADKRTLEQYKIDISRIGCVEFAGTGWCLNLGKNRFDEVSHGYIEPGRHGFIEVIGNIHENPELLK